MRNKFIFPIILLWIFLSGLCGCSDRGDVCPAGTTTRYTIAVIMPECNQREWERTVKWSIENIVKAQQGMADRVEIDVEWHDEDAVDLKERIARIAADDRVAAVIGPKSSAKARVAAEVLSKTDKPLILPIATSTELQREYAECSNVWNLTQSDMTQCEILMTQAKLSGNLRVSLLASSDEYGKSFSDWVGYHAVEHHLEIGDIIIYDDERELRKAVDNLSGSAYTLTTTLIFVPSSADDLRIFDEELDRLQQSGSRMTFPDVLCADAVNSPEVRDMHLSRSYEGISPSANPMSGFITAYREKFGEEPINGEAHLFDAVSLLGYAMVAQGTDDLNATLHRLSAVDKGLEHSWLPDDMAYTFAMIRNGEMPDLSGVTGDWSFDKKYGTTVLNTTYSHWILQNGHFTTLEYLSTDGSGRTTSTLQAWDTQVSVFQEFAGDMEVPDYGELEENWAVVISTSDTWANYRHQADALAMYQLLKRHGYDDDHIILILEDNIAYDSHNIYPGIVRVRPDGENLYQGVKVDYHLSDLNLDKLYDLMNGRQREGLPTVLPSGGNDNVIVFWTGHGAQCRLLWGESEEIWAWQIKDMMASMHRENKYRKLLYVMDACYSGAIGEACTGIPGMLLITAANATEPSKADMRDPEMGIWLSNAFTRMFQETIDSDPSISLRDLYFTLARTTTGSHATVYNSEYYGNLYRSSMDEFLK